jgi:D-glycero-D-manno-heptose 1,7-bisphosphate phosphatase
LLFQIQERYGVTLTGVPYVGDSLRDMQAAESVGCVPHLVRTGRYPDATAKALPAAFPVGTQVHADLAAFVDHLLGESAAVNALS